MATDTTHITAVLDESGSMGHLRESVVAGFNEFVDGLRGEPARMTLIMFDSHRVSGGNEAPWVRVKFSDVPLAEVKPLTVSDYQPGGGTPLRDAVGAAITDLRDRVNGDKALVAIWTDGQENSSREIGAEAMRTMIADAEKTGWAFLYLGANQDSWKTAADLGMTAKGQAFNTSATPSGLRSSNVRAGAMAQHYMGHTQEDYLAAAAATPDVIAEDESLADIKKTLEDNTPKATPKDHYSDAKSAAERAREVMRGTK